MAEATRAALRDHGHSGHAHAQTFSTQRWLTQDRPAGQRGVGQAHSGVGFMVVQPNTAMLITITAPKSRPTAMSGQR